MRQALEAALQARRTFQETPAMTRPVGGMPRHRTAQTPSFQPAAPTRQYPCPCDLISAAVSDRPAAVRQVSGAEGTRSRGPRARVRDLDRAATGVARRRHRAETHPTRRAGAVRLLKGLAIGEKYGAAGAGPNEVALAERQRPGKRRCLDVDSGSIGRCGRE